MFFLIDDHGQRLGKFRTRDEAKEAFDQLVAEDALAADECAVIELDAHGKKIGEPITYVHA